LGVLLAIGAAGALVWLATKPSEQTTGGYWATLGLLAGAGLVFTLGMALSRMARGRPLVSVPVLVGLIGALVVVAWVGAAQQPQSNWFGNHVDSWSDDIGIGSLVDALGTYVGVLAFGLGALLGWAWEPTREQVVRVGVPHPMGTSSTDDGQATEVAPEEQTRAA
jgi:hypothetical protein